jgi:hypothetical protein
MCGEAVLWVGLAVLDADPTCDGTVAVIDGKYYLKAVLGDTLGRIFDGPYRTQHAATCPVLHPKEKKK